MAHWFTKRLYDHGPDVRYYDQEKGKEISLSPNARFMANVILDKLPADLEHPNGYPSGLTIARRQLFRIMGLSTKATYAKLIKALAWSGVLDLGPEDDSTAYTFWIGPEIDCLANDCLNPHHYPQGFTIQAPGVHDSGGGGNTKPTQGGKVLRPLERTEELKNSKNQESTAVVLVKRDSVALEEIHPGPQLDSETAERRSRARLGLDQELKDRGNPKINPNLKEWAVILRSNGNHGALETALEYTAQGYELPQEGNWRTGSADIARVLIKLEREN